MITELDIETSETRLVLLVKANQFTNNYDAALPFTMKFPCFVIVGRENVPPGSEAFVYIYSKFHNIIYTALLTQLSINALSFMAHKTALGMTVILIH